LFLFFLCGLSNRHGDGLFTKENFNQNVLIMRNEPNFRKSQIFITAVTTMDYNEKSTMDTWSNQTQTKPIFPAFAGKIASSFVERPIKTAIRASQRIQHKDYYNRPLRSTSGLGRDEVSSLQLDTPICMVEELLPAFVTRLAKVNVNKRIVLRPDRSADESQAGLLWGSAAFFNVALRAGTDHILPTRFSACTFRNNVVEGQFAGRETPAAILAAVSVTGEDIAAIEFYLAPWQAVVEQQTYNSGDSDVEIYSGNPVVAVRLEITLKFADLAPALEIVVGVCTLLVRDDLGKLAKEQRKCPFGADNTDSHIMLVQDKNITI
jgi:hypothetical protein